MTFARLLLLALLALSAACGREAPQAFATARATKGDLVFAGSFYGELEARTSHPIFVPELQDAWAVATIDWLLPDGTTVKKDDVVLRFARNTLEEDLREKDSALEMAQASWRKVKEQNEGERINRQLSVKRSELAVELSKLNVVEGVNLVSKLELEKAKVELSRAELQLDLEKKDLAAFEKKAAASLEVERLKVDSAADKVKGLKKQLELMEIRAPADGVIYAPYVRLNWQMTKAAPGKVARPGDKLLEIPELDHFNASVFVRQRDATLVRVGDGATVTATMFPDKPIKAKVVSKDEFATTRNERLGGSTPQGNLKEMKVTLELEDSGVQLRPGGTLRADFSNVLKKDVVLVPLAALHEAKGAHSVTLASGEVRPVKVGQTSATQAEITEGLSGGEELRLE